MFIILKGSSRYPSPYRNISCLVWSIDNVYVLLCKEWWWLVGPFKDHHHWYGFFFWILSYITRYLGHQIFETLELIWFYMSILDQTNPNQSVWTLILHTYNHHCCSLSNNVLRNLQKGSRMTRTTLTLANNSWSLLCLGIWCGGYSKSVKHATPPLNQSVN